MGSFVIQRFCNRFTAHLDALYELHAPVDIVHADLSQSCCSGEGSHVRHPQLCPVRNQELPKLVEVVPGLPPKLAVQPHRDRMQPVWGACTRDALTLLC